MEQIRAIPDDEIRMRAAHDLIAERLRGVRVLVDIRSEAAKALRAADRRFWVYRRIAEACGLTGEHLKERGLSIVRGYRDSSQRRRQQLEP